MLCSSVLQQLALVDALTAMGVVPDGMVGHSVGELGCAYADGCFTLEEMLLAAYHRGMASIESSLITGYMAAIGKISYALSKSVIL
jgi:fatty acid synthase